jgi:hypothetical protein
MGCRANTSTSPADTRCYRANWKCPFSSITYHWVNSGDTLRTGFKSRRSTATLVWAALTPPGHFSLTAWHFTWKSSMILFSLISLVSVSDPSRLHARVPAVYLTSAEEAIFAFLPFSEINKLRVLKVVSGFESRPAHQEFDTACTSR